jgi:SH3-like domain-containing protein
MGCIPQSLLMLIMSLLVTFGLWTGVTVPVPGAALPAESCTIITDQADVPVRVGPGEQRAVRVFLPTGAPIPVVGQAVAGDGSRWWQVDLAGIEQAWVAQADVTSTGGCASVPAADAPAIVIAPPSAPDSPGGDPAGDDMGGASPADGSWGACGSCDSCGHAGQCVQSPNGQCLWDPAKCGGAPGGGGSDDGVGGYVCIDYTSCDMAGTCVPMHTCYYTTNPDDPCSDPNYGGPCGGGGSGGSGQ